MNAAELTKELLSSDNWKDFYQAWRTLSPDGKTLEQFTAICIGTATDWFNGFLIEDRDLQIAEMEWVAGALIKKLKQQ